MAPDAPKPIVFFVRDLPIDAFGKSKHGRQTRKFALFTLASHADSDGSNCYPSMTTIARELGMTVRGARKVIEWLEHNQFLRIKPQAGPHRVNVFEFPRVNTSVQGERKRSGCPEESERVNGSTAEGERYSSPEGERQSSYDLPVPSPLPSNKKPTKAFVLPDSISQEAWDGFEEMRRALGKPLNDYTRRCVVKKLEQFREQGHNPSEILDESTFNCWKDVYPIRGKLPSNEFNGCAKHPDAGVTDHGECNGCYYGTAEDEPTPTVDKQVPINRPEPVSHDSPEWQEYMAGMKQLQEKHRL